MWVWPNCTIRHLLPWKRVCNLTTNIIWFLAKFCWVMGLVAFHFLKLKVSGVTSNWLVSFSFLFFSFFSFYYYYSVWLCLNGWVKNPLTGNEWIRFGWIYSILLPLKQAIHKRYIYELSSRYNGITLSNIKPLIVF